MSAQLAVNYRDGQRTLKTRLATILGLLASLMFATTLAQTYKPFPGETVSQRTRNIQERVEVIYVAGDYQRALLIYEKDLAPVGDKYAQYMAGYMHLQGEGTDRDRATALAWFRLAAERDEPLLVSVRDELLGRLSPEEISASDDIYLELWKDIGDYVLIMELIREDMDILRAETGTRIPGRSSIGSAVVYKSSGETVGPNFYQDVKNRLEARIAYLDTRMEISDDVADEVERIRIQKMEIMEDLAAMDGRNR
jgi:hypothetical protein